MTRARQSSNAIRWQKPEDYNVLENGVVVGRIFTAPVAPAGPSWMRASGHNGEIRRAAHGYEPTRAAAMGGVRQELAKAVGCRTQILRV
jgi:hypothetical protein